MNDLTTRQAMAQYFKKDPKTKRVIFTGDKLDIFIPKRYETYKCLVIEDSIFTLGIFDMVINDTIKTGFSLAAHISIHPSSIDTTTRDGEPYVVATLVKGDVFMKTTEVVKNPQLAYVIFKEFIYIGNRPNYISYDDTAFIFDGVQQISGINFHVDKVVFEIMFSQLFRDQDDITKIYRLTDMKRPPIALPLRAVAHAATTTSAKLIGSYFGDCVNSALINQNHDPNELENILRL